MASPPFILQGFSARIDGTLCELKEARAESLPYTGRPPAFDFSCSGTLLRYGRIFLFG